MYGVFVSFLELVAVFTFCYWGGSGVRAAWAAATLITMVMRGCPRAVLTLHQVPVPGTGLLARLVWLGDTGVNCSGAAGARGGASPIVTQTNQARTHCGTAPTAAAKRQPFIDF